MSLLNGLSNLLEYNREKTESNSESNAINKLDNDVADFEKTKPERDKAKVKATELQTILARQTDKIKASDIQKLEEKEIKQFERKVTRQLWDLKRILYNLNIIIRTEYHEMLLEVHKPLQSYSILLTEFEKVFLKQKEIGIALDAKQRDAINKYFTSIKNDYDVLVTNMVALTKHELTPVALANVTITAEHMKERSALRRKVNQTVVSIRTKFTAIAKELKKVQFDPLNAKTLNNNQILFTCLENAQSQFEGLITLFTQRGKLAREMVINAETVRTRYIREIIELKSILDQFYIEVRSKNNDVSEGQNKILAQLKNWEEKNKEELNKDAYILAEEEQDEKKLTEETQGNMISMRNEFVTKTNAIIATLGGLAIGAGMVAAASNGNRGTNITNNANSTNNINPNSTINPKVPTGWDGHTVQTPPKDLKDPTTNLLNQNGLHTDDSRVLSERPAAYDAPKTGVLGWFRKKAISIGMAVVMAFNIAGPTVINYAQVRDAPRMVRTHEQSSQDYYTEDITVNVKDAIAGNKDSRFNFSVNFDNKEGMTSKSGFENLALKQILSTLNGERDSVARNKFSGQQTGYSVVFHPEKSLITGTTCPEGTTIGYTQTNNNNGLGFGRAKTADVIVEQMIHQLALHDSTLTISSPDSIPLKSAIIYNDNTVEAAAINLNNYSTSIGRNDLKIDISQLRKGNLDEVKKFDICLRLMKTADLARYEREVKNVMNPIRGADVQLAFTIMVKKVITPVTPAPIPIMPVADTPERMVIREEEIPTDVTPKPKPQYKKPENVKIKPNDWRNVRTKSGGNTRVRPGNTSFRTGRNGTRGK